MWPLGEAVAHHDKLALLVYFFLESYWILDVRVLMPEMLQLSLLFPDASGLLCLEYHELSQMRRGQRGIKSEVALMAPH
jgi:hypothetical protein